MNSIASDDATSVSSVVRWDDYAQPTVSPILQAALECFVEHGYHGTTIRNLASAAGLSVAGLYHHFTSKQSIIVALMQIAMDDLYWRSVTALEQAGNSIEAKLALHVECLVLFHAHRGDLAFLAANEIRGLEPLARSRHIAARDRQQRILDSIVEEGVAAGAFKAESPRDTSRAIVTMCTGVAQWYRLDGSLTPNELAGRYVVISRQALGQLI